MKIIYHCYGGAHSSVTAAAIHLGLLPMDRVPQHEAFSKIPLYDRQDANEHGHIFFLGTDEIGNDVYLTARRSRPEVLERIYEDLSGMFDIPREDYFLVNVMKKVNLTMKIGGFLSRRWGFIKFGRPIVTSGTQTAYFGFVDLVKKVKNIERCYNEEKEDPLLQRQQVSTGRPGGGYSYRPPAGGKAAGQNQVLETPVFEFKKRGR